MWLNSLISASSAKILPCELNKASNILEKQPQPFWHQRPVSWKTFFPQTWSRDNNFGIIQAHWGAAVNTDEASLAHAPVTSFLAGVLDRGCTGVR